MDEMTEIEEIYVEPAFDSQAIVDKFRDFRDRSKKQFDGNYSTMREDRAFLNGETQWNSKDSKFVQRSRYRQTVNVISNNVNSVVNQYSLFGFTFYTGNQEEDQILDHFMKMPGNSVCSSEALKNSAALGLGVMALGFEKNGLPCIYSIQDFNRVVLDPESVELDGSDMVEGALIDYRGKRWVELNYGYEYVPGERENNIVPCRKGMVPIITYFVLEEQGCHVYTLINNRAEDSGVLPIGRIPIYPVYGERYFDDDGDMHWTGMVSKGRSIQKIVNLSVTQLAERLAMSPKAQFMGTVDAFKNLDNYYKDAGSGNNPILPYNRMDKDRKVELQPPVRMDNTVQFQDISGIIGNTLGIMGSVTGVDSHGLVDQNTMKTATEINYAAETFSTNIRHYMVHLQASMKALGESLGVLLGIEGQVKVCQGPMEYLGLKQARAEIVQLIQVAEPSQKQSLIDALIETYPDNPTMAKLYARLHSVPAPTQMEMEMQQTVELMKQKIDSDQQVMQQMDQQLKYYEQQANNNDKNIQLELTKLQLNHEYDMENTILKAQLDQGVDANRAAIEEQRAVNKLESEAQSIALKVQGERAKLAVQNAKDRMELNKKAALDNIAVASAKARQKANKEASENPAATEYKGVEE
jgi:hypothetical protein